MPAQVYECMFILDPNRYARDPNGVAGEIPKIVEKSGGEVLANRLWSEQKLAYPIEGHRKGTYWLTYFRLDTARLTEFNRACQLNGDILRNLVLKVEPRLVDVLVAHARGEVVTPDAEVAEEGGEAAESEPSEPSEQGGDTVAATQDAER